MKIAILSPLDTPLAETFIQNHIKHLPFDKIVIHGGNFPYLLEHKRPSFVKVQLFKVYKYFRKIFNLETYSFREYALTKILKKHDIKLVFAEYLITGAETHHICKTLNIPIIAIALGYDISQYYVLKNYDKKYRSLFQYARYVVIVSNHMRKNLMNLNCPEDKIVYSPASPSKDFFELQPTFDNKQILAVGRFVEKKAPHYTIQAFNKVLKVHPQAILIMAGDGPLLNKCKLLAESLNIQDSVKFVGRIDQTQQRQLLESSYMFVQHSIIAQNGDSEGTPVSILEASAAGLPIVSTHHAGIPQVVKDNETGLLVAENDFESMAEKIIILLNDENMAKTFGEKGRYFVKENFTLKKHIEIISKCINKILS